MPRRAAFDPLRTYTVARPFAWGGKTLLQGAVFNDRKDMRRFRQLYDGRYLTMDENDDAPDFTHMREPALLEWLTNHGQANLAHPRSNHVRLVERCKRVWAQLRQAEMAGAAAPTPPVKTPRVLLPAPPTALAEVAGRRTSTRVRL